ncbi:hypothetical protein IG631_08882 [Alternaria alternata]|nr:hypothetical protein IG631_08882 [Alternaria alternata]
MDFHRSTALVSADASECCCRVNCVYLSCGRTAVAQRRKERHIGKRVGQYTETTYLELRPPA